MSNGSDIARGLIADFPELMTAVHRRTDGAYALESRARVEIAAAVGKLEGDDLLNLAREAGENVFEAQSALDALQFDLTTFSLARRMKATAAAALLIVIVNENAQRQRARASSTR